MTDYKSLVESLREEADDIEWDIPICATNHILEAADAIERLQMERDAAVDSLSKSFGKCKYCKYYEPIAWRT